MQLGSHPTHKPSSTIPPLSPHQQSCACSWHRGIVYVLLLKYTIYCFAGVIIAVVHLHVFFPSRM